MFCNVRARQQMKLTFEIPPCFGYNYIILILFSYFFNYFLIFLYNIDVSWRRSTEKMEEHIYVYRDLKEKYPHGTPLYPVSLHHTIKPPNSETILYTHWHPECEFLILLDGEALFTIENKHYHLKKNEGLFIPTKCLHSAKHVNYSKCEFFAVVFEHEYLINSSDIFLFNKYINPVIVGGCKYTFHFSCLNSWQKDVYEIIRSLSSYYNQPIEHTALTIKGKLLEAWQIMSNNYFSKLEDVMTQKRKQERIKPVLDYINKHYHYDLTLEELANLLSISRGQFCRIFKEVTGLTPFHYIARLRIMKSCELLQLTNKPITEIAGLVGYNNISYFNRTFKLFMKSSPSAFRKRNRTY